MFVVAFVIIVCLEDNYWFKNHNNKPKKNNENIDRNIISTIISMESLNIFSNF
jgi:hypothetical protein